MTKYDQERARAHSNPRLSPRALRRALASISARERRAALRLDRLAALRGES